MQSMLPILSNFWKGQTSEFLLNFVIWPHVVEGWAGLDAGLLVLLAVMGAMVAVVIQVMVEGMVGGVVGVFRVQLLEMQAVEMTLILMTGMTGYNDGYDRGHYHDGSDSCVDRNKNWNRDRSCSPDRNDRATSSHGRSPMHSFHQAMMERGRLSPPPQHQHQHRERLRSPCGGDGGRGNYGNSFDDQQGELRRSPSGGRDEGYAGGEEEEGLIPPE